jgi:GDP-L-fucose synthase|tara:strand:- start:14 stop:931 length:918 start_codon:yes stop_codon:yes gene_type:complete
MKVLIVGSNGLVGKSLQKVLSKNKDISELISSKRTDADLFNFDETKALLEKTQPSILINAAARVGGIYANNTKRTEFILENLKINTNLLEAAIPYNQMTIFNLGSSCIYPVNVENPINESSVMTGKLETTNSPYAMAKLTAIEIGEAISKEYGHKIINLMPTNLYGPNDKFSEQESHVIPGLIYRMHNAKINNDSIFKIWGTGKPLREFLYVEDLADAINFLIHSNIDDKILNIGSGEEISIYNLALKIKEVVGYEGEVVFDSNMPDGIKRKLLDSSKLNGLGWKPSTDLDTGLVNTYKWFIDNI